MIPHTNVSRFTVVFISVFGLSGLSKRSVIVAHHRVYRTIQESTCTTDTLVSKAKNGKRGPCLISAGS
jgi:hypothetical protein